MAPEEKDSKCIMGLVSCLQDEEGMEESELVENPSRPRSIFILLLVIATGLIVSLAWLFWPNNKNDVTDRAEPSYGYAAVAEVAENTVKGSPEEVIEANLRAFLQAESNGERLKYVYMPKEEKSALEVFYEGRGHLDNHLWNIELMKQIHSPQGEIWLVIYWDVQRNRRAVSFQKYGNQYLLHWSAMKAFCELPWDQLMVKRPDGPLEMRCYIRQYEGIWPVGLEKGLHHCFVVEDRDGLFSGMAVMHQDSPGLGILTNLPKDDRHPVTLSLGYRPITKGAEQKALTIIALKHLRWQKMASDMRFQTEE